MKDTLIAIVSALVDAPEAVQIEESEENDIIQLTISVAKEDMGKIIGKEGKVIKSIRNIMKIRAMKEEKRINITLAEIPQE